MNYIKNIKFGALLGVFFSLIIFIVCLIYVIFGNLPLALFCIIVIYAIVQIFIFMATLFLHINSHISSKLVFIRGNMALFSILAPGIIILMAYFKQQKQSINKKMAM